MADNIEDFIVTCEGGLDNKNSYLDTAQATPGAARKLLNFEPGLYGGYRRINGYEIAHDTLATVDSANAEDEPYGIFIFDGEVYSARKQQSGTTYKIYKWDNSTGWNALSPGFTLNTTDGTYTVTRLSWDYLNFDGSNVVVIVDGVNYAYMFNGSAWTQIKSTNTGADFANAGGAIALDKPSRVEVYQNHLFLSGDPTAPYAIAHSSPSKHYDFVAANGSGQIVASAEVNQIKVWRDKLIVFSFDQIGNIFVSNTDFVYRDITKNLGCIAPHTVLEVNGDLMFFSQDGIRQIAGTDKIDDFELNTISGKIQKTYLSHIETYDLNKVVGYVIRRKNQVRYHFPGDAIGGNELKGFVGGFRRKITGETSWEWGELLGHNLWVASSGFINSVEKIVALNTNAVFFYQDQGDTFNGRAIQATYTTPFLYFNSPLVRKSLRKIHALIDTEGAVAVNVTARFDWKDPDVLIPPSSLLDTTTSSTATYGGTGVTYGGTGIVYGVGIFPLVQDNAIGSCMSVQLTFSTVTGTAPYSIQSIIFEYIPQGRR